MAFCHSDIVWGLMMLKLTAMLAVAQSPRDEEGPVNFGPDALPQDESYEPHKVLYFVERPNQLLGMLLAALTVLIISGAKTSGGAMLNAIYILVLQLEPDEAIPMASITIFGGAVSDLLLNLWKKPIDSNVSLIDWDFVLSIQPMLLSKGSMNVVGRYLSFVDVVSWLVVYVHAVGAAFGASWMVFFSGLLIIALIVYQLYVGTQTFLKARAAGHDEGWRCCSNTESMSLLGAPSTSFQEYDGNIKYTKSLPWRKLGMNFGLFAATVLLTALQGGKYFSSPLRISSTSFFFLLVAMLPFIFLYVVSHYQMKGVVATYQRQRNPRFIPVPNEIQWSQDLIKLLPFHLLGIGAIAGTFGVGSEVVTFHLLRKVNFTPAARTAMSATIVFFVSGLASFDFFLWGKLDLQLAKFFLPFGFVMTLLGRLCLIKIVSKAKSRTLLLFAIAAAMFISVVPLIFMELRTLFRF